MRTKPYFKNTNTIFLIIIGFGILALFSSLFLFKSSGFSSKSNAKQKTHSSFISSSLPVTASERDDKCFVSLDQSVVQWKYLYYFPCQYQIKGVCLWPIRRMHFTYKITIAESIPLRNKYGKVIPALNGHIKNWSTYDSEAWNIIEYVPFERTKFPDFEPIAPNEYVVVVETRHVLFSDVESLLEICVQ